VTRIPGLFPFLSLSFLGWPEETQQPWINVDRSDYISPASGKDETYPTRSEPSTCMPLATLSLDFFRLLRKKMLYSVVAMYIEAQWSSDMSIVTAVLQRHYGGGGTVVDGRSALSRLTQCDGLTRGLTEVFFREPKRI